jgi:hypothetical protein
MFLHEGFNLAKEKKEKFDLNCSYGGGYTVGNFSRLITLQNGGPVLGPFWGCTR